MGLSRDTAETLAINCLAWLAAHDDLLPVFLGSTGAVGGDLGTRAQEPEFLGSVIDFIMMDDEWVVACCDAQAIPYERLMQARALLPGGDSMNWT